MIGQHIRAALPHLQSQAESRMTERIVIDRPTSSGGMDDDGFPVTSYALVYDGPGRIRTFRPYEQNPDVGAGTVTQQRVDWHIPAPERMAGLLATGAVSTWSGPVQTGDRARRLTAGKPLKTVRIAGEHDTTDQTAQRFTVDEITGGMWSQSVAEEES
jgi:hypothetical protein